MPFVVAVDGKTLSSYASRPGVLGPSRQIELWAESGSRVALFLNSDAHPRHRMQPVYEVRVGTKDVHVNILEVTGRNIGHLRPSVGSPVCRPSDVPGKYIESYEAHLTGDIWMMISHLYTEAEADELMTANTPPAIRSAVRSIYRGLSSPLLTVDIPQEDSDRKQRISLRFMDEMQNNARANTTSCSWLSGVLPRCHPFAYAALLVEAAAAGVTDVRVTSGWRPMLGSIAHRAGVGLDINYAEGATGGVPLNRAALTKPGAPRNGQVSKEEEELYADYMKARNETVTIDASLARHRKLLAVSRDEQEKARLRQEMAALQAKRDDSKAMEAKAGKAWEDALARRQPGIIHTLRERLGKNPAVKQLFDPWYMDANTRDSNPPEPNPQITANERLHNNHLHITIYEPWISG